MRGCGHDRAWAHRARLIDECAACGKQHSLLAGTIFEQTKTGLAKWFLAIFLVTSSKGGIAAMELKRQMGFGSYQTAWSWLHKIRKAMVAAGSPAAGGPGRGRRDLRRGPETRPPGPGCGREDQGGGRCRERPRQGQRAPPGPAPAGGGAGRFGAEPGELSRARRGQAHEAAWPPMAGPATAVLPPPAAATSRSTWPRAGVTRSCACPRSTWCLGLAKRWLLGTHHGAVGAKHLPAYLDEFVFRFNRRTAKNLSHRFARVIEHAVRIPPTTYRTLVAAPAWAGSRIASSDDCFCSRLRQKRDHPAWEFIEPTEPVAELTKPSFACKILLRLPHYRTDCRNSFHMQEYCGMTFYVCQRRVHSATGSTSSNNLSQRTD